MHDNDQAMRDFATTLALPKFEDTAFTTPPALREARVAIVTSAALTRSGGISKRRTRGGIRVYLTPDCWGTFTT